MPLSNPVDGAAAVPSLRTLGTGATQALPGNTATGNPFATPSLALSSSAAAGTSASVIRSDSTIAVFDTTVPTTQAFGDAAAVGTAAFAARRDHKHAMPAMSGVAVYGDGSDGAVTFDGTTTILGIVPSPSSAVNGVYTLARDLFLADGSALNSGISIITNGFRIFCQGTFTNNGTIKWNGTSVGNSATGGAAINNNTSSFNTSTGTGTSSPGVAGVNAGTGIGNNGNSPTTIGWGGNGGAGGTGTGGAGGTGGTVTAPTSIRNLRFVIPALLGNHATGGAAVTFTALVGGASGGAGGGDGSASGGGSGGAGGVVIVAVKAFAGTGAIQARGGDGGTRTAGSVGGGGGGGGGLVIVVSSSIVAGAISGQTIDANGGARGLKVGGGTENAVAGSNGTVILLPN